MEKKAPISLVGTVAVNSTKTKDKTFDRDGAVTNVFVPTYSGQEHDLQYRVFIEQEGTGNPRNLIDHLGQDYIGGNGEVFDIALREEFTAGDRIILEAKNVDATYSYTANVYVTVDYEGPLGGAIKYLRGVV